MTAVVCESFARADPLQNTCPTNEKEKNNNTNLKSSDEDFTYSGVVASNSGNGDLLMLPKRTAMHHDDHENSTAPPSNENQSLEAIMENNNSSNSLVQLISFTKIENTAADHQENGLVISDDGQPDSSVSQKTFNVIVHRLPGKLTLEDGSNRSVWQINDTTWSSKAKSWA